MCAVYEALKAAELLFFERVTRIGLSVARVARHIVLTTRLDSATVEHRIVKPRYLVTYRLLIRTFFLDITHSLMCICIVP